MAAQPIHRYLDHAVLKPRMDRAEAAAAIRCGVEYEVRTVCVRPCDIELGRALCEGTATGLGCVVAFPHGTARSESKADEARRYVDLGVAEIDMVVNYALIRSAEWQRVRDDIGAVTQVARPAGVLLKVILETSALDLDQIARATEIAVDAEADFVKTSTGFADGGATEEAVRAMLDAAAGRIGVKASGGIRDRQRAEMFLAMGCTRLGVGSTSTPIICGQAAKEQTAGENY
ncbi:MAG TPA: deoxyribose-phosphate aldolase [Phycisphaerae bacterium]|nr:deoxyribose-phosphate aldolase [Phycisphaerae bacterium]